jgi:hypothetical protein
MNPLITKKMSTPMPPKLASWKLNPEDCGRPGFQPEPDQLSFQLDALGLFGL